LAEPKSLPIVHEQFYRRATSVAENIDGPAQRVGGEELATNASYPVYPSTEVHRVDGHKDLHVRRDLDHRELHSSRASPTKSTPAPCPNRIVNFLPPESDNSTSDPIAPIGIVGFSSTNEIGTSSCVPEPGQLLPHRNRREL
jgi:hypothetical protein